MAPPALLPLALRPLIAVPVALRAANTMVGLLVLQGITMGMWRGMLNRVSLLPLLPQIEPMRLTDRRLLPGDTHTHTLMSRVTAHPVGGHAILASSTDV